MLPEDADVALDRPEDADRAQDRLTHGGLEDAEGAQDGVEEAEDADGAQQLMTGLKTLTERPDAVGTPEGTDGGKDRPEDAGGDCRSSGRA